MKRKRSSLTPGLVNDPLWYKDAIIYELRVRSFVDSNGDGVGDFQGLTSRLDYLQDLGVTAVWLLPFYPSPGRDDGYDTQEYTEIHPDVGTLADFDAFLAEAHRRGIRVITELVLNHTSDQHPWFQRARRAPPGSPERDFYVWSDTPERYGDARIIFKDFEPSNWSWDRVANAYYWHRFFAHQPDLNFENPALHEALLKVVDFWFARGVDGLRLDAVPYLYEEEGTNCENLPRTHAFLKKLRAHVDSKFENRMLLAEANQWPEDAAAYFGNGDECHMNFHFPIMPRMFMAIHMEDRLPIVDILAQTPKLPGNCQWAIFLRNHDELTLEMVTDDERDYMYKAYAKENAARINLGIRRRLAPLVGNDRRTMELLNSLLFSLPGTPVVCYGDEIAMGDNVFLGDRNGVRTPMQWSSDRNAGFSRTNPQRLILPIIIDPEYHYESVNVEAQQSNPSSLLWWMKRIVALRKQHQAFGRGTLEFLNPTNSRILAFVREHEGETILVVANLSRFAQCVELDLSRFKGTIPTELFGRTTFTAVGETPYMLTLGGHGFYWLALERAEDATQTRASLVEIPVLTATSPSAIFSREERMHLEDVLPAYLEQRPWYTGRKKTLSVTRIVEMVPLGEDPAKVFWLLVRNEYVDGEPETFSLPVAVDLATTRTIAPSAVIAQLRTSSDPSHPAHVIYDAFDDPARARTMLGVVLEGTHHRGELGAIVGTGMQPGDGALDAKRLGGEESATKIQYGERFVVKWYRRVDPVVRPELEIARALSKHVALPITEMQGAVEHQAGRFERTTLGLANRWVPAEGTAWQFTTDEVRRFFDRALARGREELVPLPTLGSPIGLASQEPPQVLRETIGAFRDVSGLLGRRTAELHLALAALPPGTADDTAFAPEPYSGFDRRSKYQTLRNLSGTVFRSLRASFPRLPDALRHEAQWVLAREADMVKRFEPLLTAQMSAKRIRCHGDLHLGNVLYTGKDFVFTDFDGGAKDMPYESRRRKRSPLRDLAAMVRSFHFAAFKMLNANHAVRETDREAAESWAQSWASWVSASFLASYLKGMDGTDILPRLPEHRALLFDAFVFERVLGEMRVALDGHVEDLAIPFDALQRMLET